MDEDEYIPFTVPLDFFKNEIPTEFALGSQHVSYFVNLPVDSNPSTVSRELLLNVPEEFLPIHMRVKTAATALARV